VKKQLAYLLLTLYVTVQVRPLAILAEDLLAHVFYEAQHMATVHYENGKYHIHADLEKASQDESASSEPKNISFEKQNDQQSVPDKLIYSSEDFQFPPSHPLVEAPATDRGHLTITTPPPDPGLT
jgi:hypothetical protein